MTIDDTPFQLGEAWHALGVVTPERLAAMRAEWERGEDRNPEHYRWRAFLSFLGEHRPLGAELAAALYNLGERDSDEAMGASMMDTIVRLPECPELVLDAAATSGRPHLTRLVERRRAHHGDAGRHRDPAE